MRHNLDFPDFVRDAQHIGIPFYVTNLQRVVAEFIVYRQRDAFVSDIFVGRSVFDEQQTFIVHGDDEQPLIVWRPFDQFQSEIKLFGPISVSIIIPN